MILGYLGLDSAIMLVTEGGRRFAETTAGKVAVVIAGAKQASALSSEVLEGVYVVGTGDTGASATFVTLGIGYCIVMMITSVLYRVPAADWTPEGWDSTKLGSNKMVTENTVHIDQSLKTPQFWFIWVVLCMNVTAGIGSIGVGKAMANGIFADLTLALAGFFATYVVMISVFNRAGRFFWAPTLDGIGIALYRAIPYFASSGGMIALWGFYIATMLTLGQHFLMVEN